jgi:hypothetical protein
MPRPVKLLFLIAAIRDADPLIECDTQKGKGSHCVFSKKFPDGSTRSFPLPTSSGEVVGPYQKSLIRLFDLPKDVFDTNTKRKKSKNR